ncbi:DUF4198 domain-containing protein [Thauera sp. Sel9]|uniref:DUF4198 domain-containing protein n=1 Tax=Thauera sp. Sel9 TaxID=2974299 RepID=UPI0021E193A3|nr:DUF4198 domain-containing protein [Thauera sp. Sel9]MCV2219505.1 DUF4198 domain-containing protein [Thauera sp. Sel9]
MNMKTSTRSARGLLATLLAVVATGAAAHTVWLEREAAGQYRVAFGGHEGRTEAYAASKVGPLDAFAADGGTLPVVRSETGDGVRVRVDGDAAVLLLSFDNGIWSRAEAGRSVEKPMNEVPGAVSGVRALKYHKTISSWDRGSGTATRAWGQPFELVPADAAAPRAGVPLKLRVLIDGKPAAGISVAAGEEGGPGAVSDADGYATIVPQAGFNRIWAGQRSEVEGDPRYTTLSIEYLLGFDAEPQR